MCGAFLHDIDLAIELEKRGHHVAFMSLEVPSEGVNGGTYRGFKYMHFSAGSTYLEMSQAWICPHAPALPEVRKINARGYDRPIIATCHYDGNYNAIIRNNPGRRIQWVEMFMFVNSIMEPNYRANVVPWPPNIVKTAVVRPLMHENKIKINEEFRGDCITLVNANQNKGVAQFIDMAKQMPDRKFLGVIPYYGERSLPPSPDNIEWIPFDDRPDDVIADVGAVDDRRAVHEQGQPHADNAGHIGGDNVDHRSDQTDGRGQQEQG